MFVVLIIKSWRLRWETFLQKWNKTENKKVKCMWNINLRVILTTFITCLASLSGLFVGKAAKQRQWGEKTVVSNSWLFTMSPDTVLRTSYGTTSVLYKILLKV